MNNEYKKFIGIIDKVDKTDIIPKFKSNSYFKKNYFLFEKNDIL